MWRVFAEQQREVDGYVIHAFVDIDNNPHLAERFGIKSTPAFLFFRNNKVPAPSHTSLTLEVLLSSWHGITMPLFGRRCTGSEQVTRAG